YADLVLGLAIEGLQIGVGDRPVDAAAIAGAQAKIVRNVTQAGAEPVPGGAAQHFQIGTFEFVRPELSVPVIGIVADRVIGLWTGWKWAFGYLDRGVPEALRRFSAIDPCPRLQYGDLHTGLGQLRGQHGSRDTRSDDDHIRFNVRHAKSVSSGRRIRPVAGLATALAGRFGEIEGVP